MTKPEELPAWMDEDMEKNWHRYVREWWGLIGGAPHGTDEENADKLRGYYEQFEKSGDSPIKRHVLNALVLDLICESFPEGHPLESRFYSL